MLIVLGSCLFAFADSSGFYYTGETFKTINLVGTMYNSATGINNHQQVVGSSYYNADYRSYLWSNGNFTTIAYPGGSTTMAESLNDSATVVGYYGIGDNRHGFTYSNGSYCNP